MNKRLLWILACSGLFTFCKPQDTVQVDASGEKPAEAAAHLISVSSLEETRDFYSWKNDRIPLVSAHRGGPYPGFPENAIETFANVIKHTPTIIELDVAMTKDSVLVLMHDDDLDRTTNGTGKVEEVTYDYIQGLLLEDNDGKLTDFKVPTLKEALLWSKGKVLLTVDIKRSVPFEKVVEEVHETQSEAHAALITYSFAAAKKLHSLAPELMLSITIRNEEEIQRMEETGIPWDRAIAFTGLAERSPEFNKALHDRGVFTILGVLGNLDKSAEARGDELYATFVQNGADILATDRPIEAAAAIQTLAPKTSSKSKYFNHAD
ncbi:glycerophosphodiester phosphodiesterase family protein [Algoriphagus sp. H41]|uniref:Glycerophosphodiester phosphodiesterase family protein n=1 Tax=Algoriphagus oliviformis TaxID=2811231 RepID=A0ABS3C437_9BACT|nr:glycerophosphodiester phosphodiesterase family protein [Algoriphagus oliviformis]MBN7811361.1 glycerophosphodiester phosphodiesterase family protein [Algoriphagus oliviformis]